MYHVLTTPMSRIAQVSTPQYATPQSRFAAAYEGTPSSAEGTPAWRMPTPPDSSGKTGPAVSVSPSWPSYSPLGAH